MAALLLGVACGDPVSPEDPGAHSDGVALEVVASGLSNPLHLAAPPGDPRLFVVEQPGRIRIVRDGVLLPTPFLDLTDRVRSGGERGLLGLAFHPGHASNGFFYMNYTDRQGDTRVERYARGSDPDRADPGSASPVLHVEQPFGNHNGGLVAFGPDGMFYVGMGDGGGSGDPGGHGQDLGTLLGALLRLDVDGASPYGIPPDNPFVGQAGARPEIWAYGLRNPWRFSFDPPSGMLYIADVGQNRREEVNAVPASAAGLNYGWNVLEGTLCYPRDPCDRTGMTAPVLEYGHGEGCSVTGGHVYRGSALPDLVGHYLYADYCAGWVRSFRLTAAGGVEDERELVPPGTAGRILSFGADSQGEAYVLSESGRVYRIVPAS